MALVTIPTFSSQFVAPTGIAKSHRKLLKFGNGAAVLATTKKNMSGIKMQLDNNEKPNGEFGTLRFGGKFEMESQILALLANQEAKFSSVLTDPKFQAKLEVELRDIIRRYPAGLYYAERLTNHYKNQEGKGPEIYIKAEDLSHRGVDNLIAQVIIAKQLEQKSVIAATGVAHQYRIITTAAVCAKHGLECTIFMPSQHTNIQSSDVKLIESLGAQVKFVEGNVKHTLVEAIKEWIGKLKTSSLVKIREEEAYPFQETRKQGLMELDWGDTFDVVLGCIGIGTSDSTTLGVFNDIIKKHEDLRLILVQPNSGINHSATLSQHKILVPHSIREGLELSFLKDTGKVEFHTVADAEAGEAYNLLFNKEGIFPSKEASYAFAYLHKLCPTLPDGCKVVVYCSGRPW